jgi:hypothetical protein
VDLQDRWTVRLLGLFAALFGGATAYGRGVGAWRDATGRTHWDRVTVIEAWVDPALRRRMRRLGRDLDRMRRDLRQKAVGCILDGVWTWYTEEDRP